MAKIQKIRHEHQAPFWSVLILIENQAVTRGENMPPQAHATKPPSHQAHATTSTIYLRGGGPKYFVLGL